MFRLRFPKRIALALHGLFDLAVGGAFFLGAALLVWVGMQMLLGNVEWAVGRIEQFLTLGLTSLFAIGFGSIGVVLLLQSGAELTCALRGTSAVNPHRWPSRRRPSRYNRTVQRGDREPAGMESQASAIASSKNDAMDRANATDAHSSRDIGFNG